MAAAWADSFPAPSDTPLLTQTLVFVLTPDGYQEQNGALRLSVAAGRRNSYGSTRFA
jgi:hypothetical protein